MFGLGLPFHTFSPFIASAGSPTSSNRKSACLELTASMMPVSPPWPMTRTCSLLWSCTALAITEACALSSVPGCSVAKPTVCCASAALENAAAAMASIVLKFMRPSSSAASLPYDGEPPTHDIAQGSRPLFGDRRPAAAQVAARWPRRGVDDRQRRGMVDRAQHAAHRAAATLWSALATGSAQLGVA